jgi:hypothetical protein
MKRILLGFLIVFYTIPAAAQSVKLTADEMSALLTGNTAVGLWNGTPYRQYFGADGATIYAQKNTKSAFGKWRIDANEDEYQSIWPSDDEWEGWYIMEYSKAYYWVSKSTPPTLFRIEEGQQLDWSE